MIRTCAVVAAATLLMQGLAAQTSGPAFDSSRAWEYLRQLVAIGPRPAGSPGIEQARRYIREQLKAAGVASIDQAWTEPATPIGPVQMVNIRATLPGAQKDRIIIAGHYDTKLFREFRFVGADDGGSSAAFVLEMAHALKGRRNPLTVELLFLDGEEAFNRDWIGNENTYGSRHYVEAAKKDGSIATVKALILVDMIADRNLRIKKDTNSTGWLNDIVWAAARRLGYETYFQPRSTTIGGDDHFPFLAAGVPSIDIIDLEYEAWHTSGDTLDAVSARSLQIVGDTVVAALPAIEARLTKP